VTTLGPSEALWESGAEAYDGAYDADTRGGRLLRARLEATGELLGAGPGRALDAGMGGGRLCQELDRRGWTVFGLDRSAAMVALARGRLPHRAEHLVRGPIEELPFGEKSFDAVTALGVLEYSDDVSRALGEVARVLRPLGQCVLSFPNFRGLPSRWRRHVLYPAARAVKRAAKGGRPAPAAPGHVLRESELLRLLGVAGLVPYEIVRLGTGGARLAGDRLGPILAAQIVVSARLEAG
jgi:SAM-dependent methyltransferase